MIFNRDWTFQDEATDTEVFIETTDNKMTIAFAGSESWQDWLLNFWALPAFVNRGREHFLVHSGFYVKWIMVKERIFQRIRDDAPNEIEIFGHSQGGAIAVYCHEAVRESFMGATVRTVVAGCPRPFFCLFSGKQRRRCADVVNMQYGNDVVTKLPPLYRRVGKLVRDGLRCRWWKFSIKDHNVGNYEGMA